MKLQLALDEMKTEEAIKLVEKGKRLYRYY